MEDHDEVEPAGFTEDGVGVRLLIGQHVISMLIRLDF